MGWRCRGFTNITRIGDEVGNVAPTDAQGHVVHGPDTQSTPSVLTDAVSPASVNMLVA